MGSIRVLNTRYENRWSKNKKTVKFVPIKEKPNYVKMNIEEVFNETEIFVPLHNPN